MNDKIIVDSIISMKVNPEVFSKVLNDIKTRIRIAQIKSSLSVNSEMINMYWDIGKIIFQQQKRYAWGSKVIRKIALNLKNELPKIKGFSERNLKFMVQFYNEYNQDSLIGKQAVSQFEKGKQLVSQIPWGHNIVLMQKIKTQDIRFRYIQQTINEGWSRDVLKLMIKNKWHERQGKVISNFRKTLPNPQSELAQQMLKDPYQFDFLTITEPFSERELETNLVKHLEKFLIELGAGFAFVGRQYHLKISYKDFYIDLLFYHLQLRSYIVIELKKGDFKPEYSGKLNFYCSAVDDLIKHSTDQPTIGLLLCQNKDKIFAEYALKDINKPIGISEYELTKAVPDNLKSSLPSIKEIEAELSSKIIE